jgi:CubicO group peptidase (beta-lactamase class C family)
VYDCRFATPVTLIALSPGRWRGIVTPLDDEFTLYLPIALKSDGTLSAFLRNPEFNLGHTLAVVERAELDGRVVKLVGRPSEDGPEVVAAQGIYDADRQVLSISIPQAGGTYDFTRAGPVDEVVFYPRPKGSSSYVYRPPLAEDDGWPVGTIDDAGISREMISRFVQMLIGTPMDSSSAPDIHAVLIARHGKLVLEEYFHGMHREALHDTRSAAKSLTSVLTGAAILHGEPIRLSTPVYQTMYTRAPDDPRKAAITVEHLLNMSSGLDCDDGNPASPGHEMTMQTQTEQPDWYRFALDQKMVRAPGELPVYNSAGPNLVGGVLARTTGRWLPDLFRDFVAEPMQIRRYAMNLTPTGDAYMGGGVHFRPRDFMKLAQMVLDGGRWHGRQIVSTEWADRSTAPLRKWPPLHYGYLWWVKEDYPWQGGTVRAFFAAGNGGQVAMAVPELDLVVACYGGNYSHPAGFLFTRVYVPKWILPAVNKD